ncbi:MAG TPA: Ig-like domain-containing protein, partial [Caldilineaceae bacterium]|nr:Ig-like domain-containing protein [Caldilineaceae bacterium]
SEGNGGALGELGGGASTVLASLTHVTFTLNLAGGHGGALYAENGRALLVTHSLLDQNSAAGAGGALYALTSTITLSDVAVLHNEAQTDAGGLYLRAGHSTLYRVQLVENTNGGIGGGALIEEGQGILDRTLLHGNVAEGDGGGLAVRGGASITTTNLLLVGNAGRSANAIDVAGATVRLINSTLAGHHRPGAAGLRVAAGGILTAANVIFWDSGATVVDDGAAAITELHTLWGGPDGGANPRFARTPSPGDGDWRTPADNDYGDLHLRSDSPAIDAGDGALLPAGIAADFDGAARIVDTARLNATALPVDQGAFENAGVAAGPGPGGPYHGHEGTPVDLAATGDTASAAENGTTFAWDCTGDGSFEVDGPAATCTYPDDGSYTARLRVSEGNGLSTVATATVIVANVVPTVTAPAGQSASEGLPQSFSIGTLLDPGADAPWTVTVRWGDGQPDTTFTVEQAGSLPTQGHTFADDSERQGAFTVEVSATDKDGATAVATFPIEVANQPPVAADDQAATAPDTTLLIDVLVNDADLAADPLTLTEVGAPAHGLAEIQGAQVRYTPAAGFQGTDSFTYAVSDDEGGSASATVTVTVGSPEDRLFLPMLVR